MSKTLNVKDLLDNPETAKKLIEEQARAKARYFVIKAKRETKPAPAPKTANQPEEV